MNATQESLGQQIRACWPVWSETMKDRCPIPFRDTWLGAVLPMFLYFWIIFSLLFYLMMRVS
jgi:hypothetical protein